MLNSTVAAKSIANPPERMGQAELSCRFFGEAVLQAGEDLPAHFYCLGDLRFECIDSAYSALGFRYIEVSAELVKPCGQIGKFLPI